MDGNEYAPYHSLVAAVIVQAIRDRLQGSGERCLSAHLWISSDDVRPFSFLWCCSVMSLDPELVRKAIKAAPGKVSQRLKGFEASRKNYMRYSPNAKNNEE